MISCGINTILACLNCLFVYYLAEVKNPKHKWKQTSSVTRKHIGTGLFSNLISYGGESRMTVYEIIKDVEKRIPHNTGEMKTKMLIPTYRFVKSPDFALGIIIIAILFAMILLPKALAYSQGEIDRNGIKNVKVNDLKQNTSSVTFDFCLNKYSSDVVGALVVSDINNVPVPIDLDSVKYGNCVKYGATVLAESGHKTVTLFQNDAIDGLISSFNAKIHSLKNDLAQTSQQINQHKQLGDNEKVDHLAKKADLLEQRIKSAQSGLKTLIAMKES